MLAPVHQDTNAMGCAVMLFVAQAKNRASAGMGTIFNTGLQQTIDYIYYISINDKAEQCPCLGKTMQSTQSEALKK